MPQEKRFLKLKDPEQRLQQYMESLRFYIVRTKLSQIVLCDNSDYDFSCADILALAERHGKKLEILRFTGNAKEIIAKGKGYGEGEIIEYALSHSKLLRNAEYFVKVTGRLKVCNIDELVEKMDTSKVYINKEIRNFQRRGKQTSKVSTVLYGIPKKTYITTLGDAYTNVCDKRGIFLEHVFYDRITNDKIAIHNMPRFPAINGVSGSLGDNYQASIGWERNLYDLLSRWHLFNCDLLRDSVTYVFQR